MPVSNNGIFKSNLYNQTYLKDEEAIHYLKKQLNEYNENEVLIPGKYYENHEVEIKIFNWYIVSYSKLENFIVCKAKDYKTEENLYLVFDIYHYYLCTEELVYENQLLEKLKNEIDINKTISGSSYIYFNDFTIVTNSVIVQKYFNFKKNYKNDFEKKNLYLFLTPFKIIKPESEINHNFNQYRWFFVLNNINPSGSYKINMKYFQKIKPFSDFQYKTYYSKHPDKIFNNEINDDKFLPISRVSLDIECKHFGIFPTPEKCPISHICVEWYDDGRIKKCNKKIIVLINTDIIYNYTNNKNQKFLVDQVDSYINDSKTYNFIYASEVYILHFIQYILLKDFDYILTFNGHAFDIPYIEGRRKLHNLPRLFTINICRKDPIDIQMNAFQDIRHDIKTNNTTMFLDIHNYAVKFYPDLDRYSLEMLSKIKFSIEANISDNGDEYIIYPILSKNSKIFYNVLRTANFCFINDKAYKIKNKKEIIKNDEELYDIESITNSIGKIFTIFKRNSDDDNKIKENQPVEICLSKDDIDIGDKEIYNNYSFEKAQNIAYYCIHDTVLCNKHFEVDMIDYKIRAFATQYFLPQHLSISYKSSTNSLGELLYTLINNKTMIKSEYIEFNSYDGGFVVKPKRTYVFGPTLILDFKSLYPTCVVEANLSPEKIEKIIVSDDEIANNYIENYIDTVYRYPDFCNIKIKNGTNFIYIITQKDKPGIIPKILMRGMEKRSLYKKLMKENEDNDVLYSVYDSLQYAVKIFINSIYGLLGSDTFIFKSKYCAQFCTALGQESLKYIYRLLDGISHSGNVIELKNELNIFNKNPIRNIYNSNLNTNFKIDIVYGDTDSLFVNIRFEQEYNIDQKLKYAINIGKFLDSIINNENNNIFPRTFELEFEAVNLWIIIMAKKKYIAEQVSNFKTLEIKLITKGTALIRRDYPKIHKDILREVVQILKDTLLGNENRNVDTIIFNYLKLKFTSILKSIEILDINDFVRSMKYSGKYKDPNNIIEQKIKEYNRNNPNNTILKGNRFSFIYGKIITEWTDDLKKWNEKNTIDISKQIIIIPDNLNNLPKIRICVEKYFKNILSNLDQIISNKKIIENIKIELCK